MCKAFSSRLHVFYLLLGAAAAAAAGHFIPFLFKGLHAGLIFVFLMHVLT